MKSLIPALILGQCQLIRGWSCLRLESNLVSCNFAKSGRFRRQPR